MTGEIVPLWINGERKEASDGATFEVRNALTGAVVSVSASASSQDANVSRESTSSIYLMVLTGFNEDAVSAAAKAQPAWERVPMRDKQGIFMKAISLIESDTWQARISKTVKDETASTDPWVLVNIMGAIRHIMLGVDASSAIYGKAFPSSFTPGGQTIVQRKPHGVW